MVSAGAAEPGAGPGGCKEPGPGWGASGGAGLGSRVLGERGPGVGGDGEHGQDGEHSGGWGGIGPPGGAWDPGGVAEREGGVLCLQVPELEKATVRVQQPERVMGIIRSIKEQGTNKLQVLALFGSGCGGAGPAASRRCIAVTLCPCLQLPSPSSASPAVARLLPTHVQGGTFCAFCRWRGRSPEGEGRTGLLLLWRPTLVALTGWAFFFPVMQAINMSQSPNNPLHPRQ